jgi:hypothetical protein
MLTSLGRTIRFITLSALTSTQVLSTQTEASTVRVNQGEDLQAALTRARPGDIIELAEGAMFTGNFTLPRREGSGGFITLRSALSGGGVAVGRVNLELAARFAKLRSTNGIPALRTAPGAHHWRIEFIEIMGSGSGDVVTLGDGSGAQNVLADVPHDLVLDRVYVHGDPTQGVKRCIALNSASTTVSNSWISDCKAIGQDSQAIAGWNGPGPFSILNNYLEGAAENVLFGGADPAIPNLVPSDITIRGNLIAKPQAWRQQRWQIKNLLELKNARRVTIDHNILEYNWSAAQVGFAVLFTVRNQDGRCPWCQVEQVAFTDNIVRHSAAGVQILGFDNLKPSQQTRSIQIRNNVFSDINPKAWGGNGYAFLLLGGPRDIVIDHNTLIQENAFGIVQVEGPPIPGFVFTNNVARHGSYGIIGANHAPGSDSIQTFFPGATISRNVLAEGNGDRYPSGNFFPSLQEFRSQFMAYDAGDYRLASDSRWRNGGTDGLDLGAIRPAAQEREGDRRRRPALGAVLAPIDPLSGLARQLTRHQQPGPSGLHNE